MITEPRWKSLIVETTNPIFTPEQCQLIINAGRSEQQEMGQVVEVKAERLILKLEHHILVGFHLIRCLKCIRH